MFPAYYKDDILKWSSIQQKFQSQNNRCGSLLSLHLKIIDRKELKSNKYIKKTSIYADCTPSVGGYTYSWKSSRWFTDTKHHIQFVIYEKLDSEDLIVRHVFHTSQFALFSTRYLRYKKSGERKQRTKIVSINKKKHGKPQEYNQKSTKELLQKLRRTSADKHDAEYISVNSEKETFNEMGTFHRERDDERIGNTGNDLYCNITKKINMELLNLKRRIDIDENAPGMLQKSRRYPALLNNPTSFLISGHDYNSNTTSLIELQNTLPIHTMISCVSDHTSNAASDILTPTLCEAVKSVTPIVTPTIII